MTVEFKKRGLIFQSQNAFIIHFREYLVNLLKASYGIKWEDHFLYHVFDKQKLHLDSMITQGKKLENLIDFSHISAFTLKDTDLFKSEFGREYKRLPTWFLEITEFRNKIDHHDEEIENDEVMQHWFHIQKIARIIKDIKLQKTLADFRSEYENLYNFSEVIVPQQNTIKKTSQKKTLAPEKTKQLKLNFNKENSKNNITISSDIKSDSTPNQSIELFNPLFGDFN